MNTIAVFAELVGTEVWVVMPSQRSYNISKMPSFDKTLTAGAHMARQPRVTVFGVGYLHLRMDDGSDLYVTRYGRPSLSHLLPHNYWTDKTWFAEHSVKLPGTSALYKIKTKEIEGRSKDIVLKWNRMGQDIPGETEASDLSNAAFNSPFEEFGLVIELGNMCRRDPDQFRIHTPLAIYVPRKYVEMDRLGRKRYKIEAMQKNHKEVMLDPNRRYAVLYEWIDGLDAAQALADGIVDENTLGDLLSRSEEELARRGFCVRDHKPHHIVVKPADGGRLTTNERGNVLCGLIDFELLERTPQREQAVRGLKRKSYLTRQAHRFEDKGRLPSGLTPVNIMGVDYVFGQVESTGGALWVVGKDPVLFEYFLPEKWRKTPREELSVMSRVYKTTTKDSIHLVWRISRVGELPDVDPYLERDRRILAHGYNSPFEEIAFSMELSRGGIATTYPRAIYQSGHKAEASARIRDNSRYESHTALTTDDDHPILGGNHDYMTLWGYWNGPDELLAEKDQEYYRGIDALCAYRAGLITQDVYIRTMEVMKERMAELGIEDLNLRGNHLLLSADMSGRLVMGPQDIPAVRICNFELLKHT